MSVINRIKFEEACAKGIDKVKELYNSKASNEYIGFDFEYCCEHGYLDIAKWLHSLGFDAEPFYEQSLIAATVHGRLNVVKWLYTLGAEYYVDIDVLFINSCAYGHVDVAKLIYETAIKTDRPVNIHANDDGAFKSICTVSGDLVTLKWLYYISRTPRETPIDIACGNCFPLSISILYMHYEITKWLHSLDPSMLYKIIKNVNISVCDILGISKHTKELLTCIQTNQPFPKITRIDNLVVMSLAHNNMFDHLDVLKQQFPNIKYDIIDGQVQNLIIERKRMCRVM